jgi:hypothetical protein
VPGALTYQGTLDATVAPPATPVKDGLYISTKAGAVNAGFTGVTGNVAVGDWLLYDGTGWDHVGAGSSTGVSQVDVTAPITKTGTATQPTIGIDAATTAKAGSMSAADKTKLDGLHAVTMAATPPATPVAGHLWFNTNKGVMYVWYADGTSNQWVSVMGSKAR